MLHLHKQIWKVFALIISCNLRHMRHLYDHCIRQSGTWKALFIQRFFCSCCPVAIYFLTHCFDKNFSYMFWKFRNSWILSIHLNHQSFNCSSTERGTLLSKWFSLSHDNEETPFLRFLWKNRILLLHPNKKKQSPSPEQVRRSLQNTCKGANRWTAMPFVCLEYSKF